MCTHCSRSCFASGASSSDGLPIALSKAVTGRHQSPNLSIGLTRCALASGSKCYDVYDLSELSTLVRSAGYSVFTSTALCACVGGQKRVGAHHEAGPEHSVQLIGGVRVCAIIVCYCLRLREFTTSRRVAREDEPGVGRAKSQVARVPSICNSVRVTPRSRSGAAHRLQPSSQVLVIHIDDLWHDRRQQDLHAVPDGTICGVCAPCAADVPKRHGTRARRHARCARRDARRGDAWPTADARARCP